MVIKRNNGQWARWLIGMMANRHDIQSDADKTVTFSYWYQTDRQPDICDSRVTFVTAKMNP